MCLRRRTDETESHVLGLGALLEVVGHRSELPCIDLWIKNSIVSKCFKI